VSLSFTFRLHYVTILSTDSGFFSIASRTLNPSIPFDTIIANFNHHRALLIEEVQHADREVQNRLQQQEKIDRFLRILVYNEISCEEKHQLSCKKILRNVDCGGWLLRRDDYQDWRQADSGTGSAGLFWLCGRRELARFFCTYDSDLPPTAGTGKTILA